MLSGMEIQLYLHNIAGISLLQARTKPMLLPEAFKSTAWLTSFSVWVSSLRMNVHMSDGFKLILT